jgi:hypothetical protein
MAVSLATPRPDQPEVRRSLALVEPNDLKRATGPRGVAGLPMFSEITLACFDRRRLAQAPTSLDQLLAVAASGKPIGLATLRGGKCGRIVTEADVGRDAGVEDEQGAALAEVGTRLCSGRKTSGVGLILRRGVEGGEAAAGKHVRIYSRRVSRVTGGERQRQRREPRLEFHPASEPGPPERFKQGKLRP